VNDVFVRLNKLKEGTLEIIVDIHLMLHRINVDVERKREDLLTIPFHYSLVLKNEFLFIYAKAKICWP
jgi:hypothetical protein